MDHEHLSESERVKALQRELVEIAEARTIFSNFQPTRSRIRKLCGRWWPDR
jgi:hypothetical protein